MLFEWISKKNGERLDCYDGAGVLVGQVRRIPFKGWRALDLRPGAAGDPILASDGLSLKTAKKIVEDACFEFDRAGRKVIA